MKKFSLGALVAAGLLMGGLGAGSASAADLGGNCCADLEERIAELEATTARKGNRKVSLTISGWVAEQVMWWDDGFESNVYVGGIGRTLQSHFKLTGQATISPGWYAGYVIHVEVGTPDSFTVDATTDDPADFNTAAVKDTQKGIYLLQSFWFVKSDHLGKVSIGKQSQASDNTAILVDGSGSLVPANWVLFDGASFGRIASGPLRGAGFGYGNLAHCASISDGIGGDCNGITENVVRYDSPVFAGFSMSASWGEDDMWDVAARYAGEHAGFKVAVAAAYSENTDECLAVCIAGRRDVGYFQVGGYVEHVATGLWVYGAYGKENVDTIYISAVDGSTFTTPSGDFWYVKAGLRERWNHLGHTVVYAEYGNHDDTFTPGLFLGGTTSSDFRQSGVGIVQEIDAAAMSMWVAYRHYEGDYDCSGANKVSCTGLNKIDLEDWDMVKFGALINF